MSVFDNNKKETRIQVRLSNQQKEKIKELSGGDITKYILDLIKTDEKKKNNRTE